MMTRGKLGNGDFQIEEVVEYAVTSSGAATGS